MGPLERLYGAIGVPWILGLLDGQTERPPRRARSTGPIRTVQLRTFQEKGPSRRPLWTVSLKGRSGRVFLDGLPPGWSLWTGTLGPSRQSLWTGTLGPSNSPSGRGILKVHPDGTSGRSPWKMPLRGAGPLKGHSRRSLCKAPLGNSRQSPWMGPLDGPFGMSLCGLLWTVQPALRLKSPFKTAPFERSLWMILLQGPSARALCMVFRRFDL